MKALRHVVNISAYLIANLAYKNKEIEVTRCEVSQIRLCR